MVVVRLTKRGRSSDCSNVQSTEEKVRFEIKKGRVREKAPKKGLPLKLLKGLTNTVQQREEKRKS